MFKKRTKKINSIFTISSEDAKIYLASITKDVKTIMESDKFADFAKKVKVPEGATAKEYENIVRKVVPTKVYNFLSLFIDDCYDEVRRILSAVFVTNFDEYKKKSIEEMCEDISRLNKSEVAKILGFFQV